jgi:HlyD family secretion protein
MKRESFLPLLAATLALLGACDRKNGKALKLSGNIEAVQVAMSFRVPGRILERPVDEGFLVKEGQLIARLDSQDLGQQAAAQEAAEATTRAALAALVAGSRPEEIQASKATLDQAEADLRRLEPDEARIKDLQQKGILSLRDYEATHAAFVAAKARVEQARQQYQLVKKGPRKEDIDQARARLDQAGQSAKLARTQLGYATLGLRW